MRRISTAVAALAVLAAATGCGSTVSLSGLPRSAAGAVGDGSGLDQLGTSTVPGSSGLVAPSATGTTSSTDTGQPITPGDSPGPIATGTIGSTPGSPLPKGVTATTVAIGASYSQDSSNSQLGVSGASQGDIPSQYKALVADLNARGGIAGRKIVLILRAVASNSSETADEYAQAECTYFTQDHPVFAIFSGSSEVSRQCLRKGGVSLVINQDITRSNRDVFAQYPNYIEPITLNHDRQARPWVQALTNGGYFSPWSSAAGKQLPTGTVKVGLMTFSGEQEVAVKRSLLPALAAAGHAPSSTDVYYLQPPNGSAGDASRAAADIANAVLKFRSDGVTHVLLDDYGATFSVFFSKAAEAQGYFPRYGLTSQAAAQVFLTSGEISHKSMTGAIGLGWWPIIDLADADNPVNGPFSNPARRSCETFLRAHGVTWSNANAHFIAMSTCDQISLVATVLRQLGSTISAARLPTILDHLGSLQLAANRATSFVDGQRDGAALGQTFAFSTACSCMRYTGSVINLG